MSYSATPAEERAVDALSLYDAENAVFRSDVTREELVYLVRHVLDAAMTVPPGRGIEYAVYRGDGRPKATRLVDLEDPEFTTRPEADDARVDS